MKTQKTWLDPSVVAMDGPKPARANWTVADQARRFAPKRKARKEQRYADELPERDYYVGDSPDY